MALYAINEAHSIDRWGHSHYGVPLFKPAWQDWEASVPGRGSLNRDQVIQKCPNRA